MTVARVFPQCERDLKTWEIQQIAYFAKEKIEALSWSSLQSLLLRDYIFRRLQKSNTAIILSGKVTKVNVMTYLSKALAASCRPRAKPLWTRAVFKTSWRAVLTSISPTLVVVGTSSLSTQNTQITCIGEMKRKSRAKNFIPT